VGHLLPGYPNAAIASRVTIHQLLTHTGGTGDIFGPEFDRRRLQLRTLDDYLKLYGARAPEFEPGSRWDYSNYGFVLLGAILERLSGKSYYDLVEASVYRPAGMSATGSLPEEEAVPERAIGYTHEKIGDPWLPNDDTLPYRGTSAGGGYSTAGDLLRFANALGAHRLLDAEHTRLLTTGKVDTPGSARYAYGFFDVDAAGLHWFGHGGGAPGMSSDLTICYSGYTIVVLSNLDPPAAMRVAAFIRRRLPLR
jgi:D-alanyl-D-alanine carboxypeptidase